MQMAHGFSTAGYHHQQTNPKTKPNSKIAKEEKENQEIIYTVVEWDMVKYREGCKLKFNTRG